MKYSIGVIFPSRGLCYTETLKEVLDELNSLSDATYEIYWSHGNKLPTCFNKPLARSLRASHSHILLLEDDMVIQKGTLKDMLDADEDIISCDYPIVKAPSGTVLYDQDDNAIFTGTGFMLAKKKVFDTMPRPIFRADIEWTFKQSGDKVKFTAKEVDPDKVYGHHDITFGLYQYMNNKPIKVSSHVLAQRKLVKKGDNKNNNGADEIELYDQYRKINYYMIEEEKEVNSNDLLVEIELDGRKIHVTKETADRLAKDQLIEQKVFKAGNLIIDVSECPKALKAFRKVNK